MFCAADAAARAQPRLYFQYSWCRRAPQVGHGVAASPDAILHRHTGRSAVVGAAYRPSDDDTADRGRALGSSITAKAVESS